MRVVATAATAPARMAGHEVPDTGDSFGLSIEVATGAALLG
jgi:hypothetical protein